VQEASRKWLKDDVYILEVHPFPEYETTGVDVSRAKLPTPGAPPEVKFPSLQRGKLSNGMKIVLAERHSIPMVDFSLQIDAGYAADQFATPGTARLAMGMLDEGTARRSSLQISEELASLGASLSASSSLDSSSVDLSALVPTLDGALDVYADVILNPTFPDADFNGSRKTCWLLLNRKRPSRSAWRCGSFRKFFTAKGMPTAIPSLVRAQKLR
jgi:zinc protease